MKKAFKFFILSLMTLIILSCSNAASEKTGKIYVKLPGTRAARLADGFYTQDDAIAYRLTAKCTSNTSLEITPITQEATEEGSLMVLDNLQPGIYDIIVDAIGETETVASGSVTDIEVLPGTFVPVTIYLIPNAPTPPYTISAKFNLPYATKSEDFYINNFTITKTYLDGTSETLTQNSGAKLDIRCPLTYDGFFLGSDNVTITLIDPEWPEEMNPPEAVVPVKTKAAVSNINFSLGSDLSYTISANMNNTFTIYDPYGQNKEISVNTVETVLVLVDTTNPSKIYPLKQTGNYSNETFSARFEFSKENVPNGNYLAYANMYLVSTEYPDCFVTPVTNGNTEGFISMGSVNVSIPSINEGTETDGYKVTIEADNEILFKDNNGTYYTYSSGTILPGSISDTYPTDNLSKCFTLIGPDNKVITEGITLSWPDAFSPNMIGEKIPLGIKYQNVTYYPKDADSSIITVDYHTRSHIQKINITIDETNKTAKVSFSPDSTLPIVFTPEDGTTTSITYDIYYNYSILDASGKEIYGTSVSKFESDKEGVYEFEVDISSYDPTYYLSVYAYCSNDAYGKLIETESKTESQVLNNNPKNGE